MQSTALPGLIRNSTNQYYRAVLNRQRIIRRIIRLYIFRDVRIVAVHLIA